MSDLRQELEKFALQKANPNHDEKGRFSAGDGGGGVHADNPAKPVTTPEYEEEHNKLKADTRQQEDDMDKRHAKERKALNDRKKAGEDVKSEAKSLRATHLAERTKL